MSAIWACILFTWVVYGCARLSSNYIIWTQEVDHSSCFHGIFCSKSMQMKAALFHFQYHGDQNISICYTKYIISISYPQHAGEHNDTQFQVKCLGFWIVYRHAITGPRTWHHLAVIDAQDNISMSKARSNYSTFVQGLQFRLRCRSVYTGTEGVSQPKSGDMTCMISWSIWYAHHMRCKLVLIFPKFPASLRLYVLALCEKCRCIFDTNVPKIPSRT